ncbi:MAG: bifunctional phosphoribosylaminoimidazolecarboxamide formyltransferase/IMP cyclohydrolase [Dehalococcoidia bacterium]
MRAVLSVWDKQGIETLAEGLQQLEFELFSTGNTMRAIEEAKVPVRSISDLTGFPEILDGRVKTLHPAVHGGLLARRDSPDHMAELERHHLAPIDLVVSNLYPFARTVAGGVDLTEALENIDIGGPTLIRAAAKNFPAVLVVVSPDDYGHVLELLRAGTVPIDERRRLAQRAFQHVAAYDTAIAAYLRGDEQPFPAALTLGFEKLHDLRYGENPHQRGAVYRQTTRSEAAPSGIASATLLHGPEMSFVNYVDADGAWQAVWDFDEPTCVIVKHATPCGIASRDDIVKAYELALAGDPVSAYGGIIAFNRPVDAALATALREVRNPLSGQRQLYHVLIAPAYTDDGLAVIRGKSKELRILQAAPPHAGGQRFREISGGMLVHDDDTFVPNEFDFETVSQRPPTPVELADLRFAWKACKHVKSNAIVLANGGQMVGMGAGQTNRLTSVMLAVRQAGESAAGSALASDAYFPFADGVEEALRAGVTAIVQPGGSIRDADVIASVDQAGAAMVFAGVRHFRH